MQFLSQEIFKSERHYKKSMSVQRYSNLKPVSPGDELKANFLKFYTQRLYFLFYFSKIIKYITNIILFT